jgi:hypothetical protein
VVHENAPHDARRYREEMRAVSPRDSLSVDEPQIRFVDQRSRLERVSNTFAAHAAPRNSMELVMDERDQSIEGTLVALSPLKE